MKDPKVCVHLKSGKIYVILDEDVINCTNSAHDVEMVLYMNDEGKLFVREKEEFIS